MEQVNSVVVGGGPAGIATGAALARRGVDSVVLERGETVAPAWHRHYDRLHLHTNKAISGLPQRPMPREYPRYPSRDQVAQYLDDYARDQGVDIRLGVEVVACRREGGRWSVSTADGLYYQAANLVVATGLNHIPLMPSYPRQGDFEGETIHSFSYRNGEPYAGRRVLVVGFGNSGGEIALDLMEHGAHPHLSVRSPSVAVPRDLFGIPILTVARWLSVLPPRLADWLSRPILLATMGNLESYGIPSAPWGPMEQIATQRKIPLLDIGTVDAIKEGSIETRPGIEEFTKDGVVFTTGDAEPFDAVVFATGATPGVDRLLESTGHLLDDQGRPLVSGGVTAEEGLYFCGFNEPPSGRLREIGIEAERIGELIAARVGSPTTPT